jgi:hypothetical protein
MLVWCFHRAEWVAHGADALVVWIEMVDLQSCADMGWLWFCFISSRVKMLAKNSQQNT